MTEHFPSDAELHALSGAQDSEQGVPYPAIYESPYYTTFYRMLHRLLDVARRAGDLRIYKDGNLTFGMRAGHYFDGNVLHTIPSTTCQALTDEAVNNIYLLADGTLTVNTTGFPTPSETPHLRLATITTSSGGYSHDDITDCRGTALFSPASGMTSAEFTQAHDFFAATDITGAQAEKLSDGSNADSLHAHALSALSGTLADTQLASKLLKRPARKAWGFVKLSAQLNDGDTITIDGRVYEADPSDDGITGDVEIDTSGNSTIDEDVTDIAAAINGDGSADVDAVADTTNDIVWLYAKTAGGAGNTLTLAESTSESRMIVSKSTLADGTDAYVGSALTIKHTITTNEASAGVLRIDTNSATAVDLVQIQMLDGGNGGTLKTPDVAVSVDPGPGTPGVLTITEGSAPAWAAGDILYILVVGIE